MRLCRGRPIVKNSCSANFHCMTHDIYIGKTRTDVQTDVLLYKLYVNDGCGLNNCHSIKCNKHQEDCCVSRTKICTLGGVNKIRIRPDWTGLDHGLDHGRITEKTVLKRKNSKKFKTFIS